jgi:SPP1 family phage portal protein
MVKQPDETYDVTVYDATSVWTYKLNAALSQLTLVEDAYEHHFGDVPIVFYPNGHDMQGNFEQVIPLQDALNKVVSDSVNDWESFVDSYLVLENMQGTTQDDIASMKANRVLLTDPDSKAYWLTKTADNDRIKTLQDDLRSMILELGNVPDLKDITGLSVSGEAMKFKLTKTEIQASRIERIVTAGIMRKVLLLSNVLSLTTTVEAVDVEIEFTRNFIMAGEEV